MKRFAGNARTWPDIRCWLRKHTLIPVYTKSIHHSYSIERRSLGNFPIKKFFFWKKMMRRWWNNILKLNNIDCNNYTYVASNAVNLWIHGQPFVIEVGHSFLFWKCTAETIKLENIICIYSENFASFLLRLFIWTQNKIVVDTMGTQFSITLFILLIRVKLHDILLKFQKLF